MQSGSPAGFAQHAATTGQDTAALILWSALLLAAVFARRQCTRGLKPFKCSQIMLHKLAVHCWKPAHIHHHAGEHATHSLLLSRLPTPLRGTHTLPKHRLPAGQHTLAPGHHCCPAPQFWKRSEHCCVHALQTCVNGQQVVPHAICWFVVQHSPVAELPQNWF